MNESGGSIEDGCGGCWMSRGGRLAGRRTWTGCMRLRERRREGKLLLTFLSFKTERPDSGCCRLFGQHWLKLVLDLFGLSILGRFDSGQRVGSSP